MRVLSLTLRSAVVAGATLSVAGSAAVAQAGWSPVDRAMGRPGTAQPGEVHRYSFPRADLRVTVGGIEVKPALALGSWVAFRRMEEGGGKAMAMGDLVLLETEVTPVLTRLQAMGVAPTALHNHLERESPRVMYLHIEAEGDPVSIGEAVHTALGLTKTPPASPPGAAAAAAPGLDTARLAKALGHGGKLSGGVYQVSVPRSEPVRLHGMEVPPAMGVATGINFQPAGGGRAATTGDFVLTADEVGPVAAALHEGGIAVTALHSHMLGEEPRLYFMHFWAVADAETLARTLHAALGHMKVRMPGA
ncbi:MAG TPA: DUF1259 domain-containing protein [Gemmatimonadales bacterium]|nr:DUF1259 domain-containing protein [Gemmatimonadales bacterium]